MNFFLILILQIVVCFASPYMHHDEYITGSFNFNPIKKDMLPKAVQDRVYVMGQPSNTMYASAAQLLESDIGDDFAIAICFDHGYHDAPNDLPGLAHFVSEVLLIGPKKGPPTKDGFAGDLSSFLLRNYNATINLHQTADRTIFAVTGPMDSDKDRDGPTGTDRVVAVARVLSAMIYSDGFDLEGPTGELYCQAAAKNAEMTGQARSENIYGHGPNGRRALEVMRQLARHSLAQPKSPWFNTPAPKYDEIKPLDGSWRQLAVQAKAFWNDHYGPQRSGFTIFTKHKIDIWDRLLFPVFGALPQRGISDDQTRPVGGPTPFTSSGDVSQGQRPASVEGINQFIRLPSANADPWLVFAFPTPVTLDFYRDGSLIQLETLLTSKGEHGLVARLRSKNYANDVQLTKEQNRAGSILMIWVQIAPEGIANLKKVSEEVFGFLSYVRESDTFGNENSKPLARKVLTGLKKLTAYRSDTGSTIGKDLLTEVIKFIDNALTFTDDSVMTVGRITPDTAEAASFQALRERIRSVNCNVLYLDPNYEKGQLGEHPANAEHDFPYVPTKLVNVVPVVPSSAFSGHQAPDFDWIDYIPSLDEQVTSESAEIPGTSYHPPSTNILQLTWRGQPKVQTFHASSAITPSMQRTADDEINEEEGYCQAKQANDAGVRVKNGRDVSIRLLFRFQSPSTIPPKFISPVKQLLALLWHQSADKHCSATTIAGLPFTVTSTPEGIQLSVSGPPGDGASRIRLFFEHFANSMNDLSTLAKDAQLIQRIRFKVYGELMEKRRKQQALPTALSLMRSFLSSDDTTDDPEVLLQRFLHVDQTMIEAYVESLLKEPVSMDMLVVGNMDHSTSLELADHLVVLFNLHERRLFDSLPSVDSVLNFPSETEVRFRSNVSGAANVMQFFIKPKALQIDMGTRQVVDRSSAVPGTTSINNGVRDYPQQAFSQTLDQKIQTLREPSPSEAAALIILRQIIQYEVSHIALTEPIGLAGGNVLNREGGGPWSILFYQSGRVNIDLNIDRSTNVFRAILPLILKRLDDPHLFTKAKALALQSLTSNPSSLEEATDRDWYEVASTRHYYTRRQEYISSIDHVTSADVKELVEAAMNEPPVILKVFPRDENMEGFVLETHQINGVKDMLLQRSAVTVVQTDVQCHDSGNAGLFGQNYVITPPRGFSENQGFTFFNICLIIFLASLLCVISMWGFVHAMKERKKNYSSSKIHSVKQHISKMTKRAWKPDMGENSSMMYNPVQSGASSSVEFDPESDEEGVGLLASAPSGRSWAYR